MEVIEELLVGDLKIIQDTELYRFTSDSVLLSRFLQAKKGEVAADFCAGSGIVGLHFFAENRENVASVTLFEKDEALYKMSLRSISMNGLEECIKAEHVRLQDIGAEYTEKFSLILCNPPYGNSGLVTPKAEKLPCKNETELTLTELISAAKRCLKFGGRFALCHRADRLSEVLTELTLGGLEPKKLQLVTGRAGRKPYLFLVSATKGGKKGLDVLPTLVNTKE